MTQDAEKTPLRLAAVGDLHVTDTAKAPYRELFGEISREADVVALCGDLTDLGKPSEAEILAEDLRALSIPAVAVLGNHDHECGNPEEIRRILTQAGVKFLEEHTHEIHGVGFAGVKGFAGGFGRRMLSAFGESSIKTFVSEGVNEAMRLENALRTLRAKRRVVVLHYAPISETVVGEPHEIWPFLGSSRLAEVIDRFDVSAVVHGHAHRGAYRGNTPNGVPVYNVARHIEKDGGKPYALLEI